MLASRSSFHCCVMLIYLTFALLTVARIAGAGYTVFVIFIPLFIVVRGPQPRRHQQKRGGSGGAGQTRIYIFFG